MLHGESLELLKHRNKEKSGCGNGPEGVGVYSVCCEYALLPLVNKEAALAYGRAE